jgi:hypothetical protein
VGVERGPLSLVSTTEELLERKSGGSGLESREYGRGDPLCSPRNTIYPQKLALTSPTSGGRSVGIVRSRTKGHGICFFLGQYKFITVRLCELALTISCACIEFQSQEVQTLRLTP